MPSCTHQGQRRHGCRQGRLGHPAECTQLAPGGELDLATDACCGCHADGARLCRHSAKLLHSGAAFLGTTRANLLMLLGVCKLLALLDLWVVNAIPRVTCICVACMMGAPSATYHGVLASHQYLRYVLAHRPCTRVYTDWLAHGLWQVWSPTATTPSPTTCRRPRSCAPICYSMHAHPRSSPFGPHRTTASCKPID